MSNHLLKRSQIKLFESIAVLVIFFFLVAIGLRIYGGYELHALEEMQVQFSTLDSIKTSLLLLSLPELTCTVYSLDRGSCIDLYKAHAFAELTLAHGDHYYDKFRDSLIVLEQIEPSPFTITLYNESGELTGSFRYTPVPVSIWNPVRRYYGLGILHVYVQVIQ